MKQDAVAGTSLNAGVSALGGRGRGILPLNRRRTRLPLAAELELAILRCEAFAMDASSIEKAIESNRPFRIKTAGGDCYEVPHRDFISFSAKKTTVIVSFERDGREDVAYIPLLTVSSVESETSEEPAKS